MQISHGCSCVAKGVLDPDNAVRALRQPLQSEHIETNHMAAPLGLPPQEKSSGANDFALLAPGDGAERAAEINAAALPHFDDGQHAVIDAYEVEFSGSATQIA